MIIIGTRPSAEKCRIVCWQPAAVACIIKNNFDGFCPNLFASSGFDGIVLNGCSSSAGDLRSAVAPSNARRFLTHVKSVAKTTLVEFDMVPVTVVVGDNVATVIGGKVVAEREGSMSVDPSLEEGPKKLLLEEGSTRLSILI